MKKIETLKREALNVEREHQEIEQKRKKVMSTSIGAISFETSLTVDKNLSAASASVTKASPAATRYIHRGIAAPHSKHTCSAR